MQKLKAVVMLHNFKKFTPQVKKVLDINYGVEKPFSSQIINFLEEVHKEIIFSKKTNLTDDIIAFGFWCRKKNIEKFKNNYDDINFRMGIGKIFHIAPSNTPINFAYSLAFGLLSGCANIVRVSSKCYLQILPICEIFMKLLKNKKFYKLNSMITIIIYEHDNDDKITKYISSISDARVIWGGNSTINKIKSYITPSHSFDIPFSDRYSFAIINTEHINKLSNAELKKLASNFYNDTYYVDQNACSSPHLIVWIGKKSKKTKDLFWKYLNDLVSEKYLIEETAAVDKYTQLLRNIINLKEFKSFKTCSNNIYRIELKNIPKDISSYRGRWGYFYEYNDKNLNFMKKITNKKFQTLTYAGFNKNDLIKFFIKEKLIGIDRVVPIGRSLEIGLKWDGFDIIRTLSRFIVFS